MPLRRQPTVGKKPIFIETIPVGDWNRFVRSYAEQWPLEVIAEEPAGWRHPWNTQLRWNNRLERFEANVWAGLLNEEEVEVSLDPLELPWATFQRLVASAAEIPERPAAWLSEDPWIPVPPERWNTPTVIPQVISEQLELNQQVRSFDIVLVIPKPFLFAELVEVEGTTVLRFDIRTPQDSPHLSIRREFIPVEPVRPSVEQLVAGFTDYPFDERHLATVYAISPGSASEAATPKGTWATQVKHRIFRNLNHEVEQDISQIPEQQLVWGSTGLVGGIGDAIAQGIIDQISDQLNEAQVYLNQSRIVGHAWTI